MATILDATQDWFEPGEGIADQFSSAFAACDINGDGYSDLAAGAPGYNGGQSRGRVYIYYGSPSGLVHPALRFSLTGDFTSYPVYFGSSVACGDLNGDGYGDVIIGEYGYGEGGPSDTGRVYIYLGSSDGLNPAPARTLAGQVNTQFGFSVASAGDVNGDGYGDFLVGAPKYGTWLGKVSLYLGGATLPTAPAAVFTGTGGALGKYIAPAGDVNGDGLADVVFGAPDYSTNQGRAFLYLGTGTGLGASPAITLTGQAAGDSFGQAGGAVGDVNGDGYADIMIGAGGYISGTGRAYFYLGSQQGLTATPAITLTGEAANSFFGRSIRTLGDVNGDGYADAVIGAEGYSTGLGRAYLYLGSQGGLAATPALTLTGQTASGLFGGSVGGVGDVNGDGYADIGIGAPGYQLSQGAISIYHGSALLPSAAPQRVLTGGENDQLGAALATTGDVNADGYADVIVGARGAMNSRGQAHLYLGSGEGLGSAPAVTLTGENPGDFFGSAVAAAGDVPADGYADVIVGAEGYDSGRGRAYVYLGASGGLQATPALTLTGQSPGDNFGAAVASATDVNGDGYTDLAIGAPGAGRVYIYQGGGSLSVTPSITLTGENSADLFGASVAAAGDVNGDGYADVVVGAKGYGGNQGRAYVYPGSADSLQPSPVLTLTVAGGSPGDYFGASVATAGDVNGDGYADFVVGAPGAGRVYIYQGGASLSVTPSITLTGGSQYGGAVGTAGDVNGDGYSDIIVGAGAEDTNRGRAFIYLGGPTGLDPAPVLTLSGESQGSYFGAAVGTAGDVDGDGFGDVLLGAYGYGKNEGRVYLHRGNGGGGRSVLAQAERPVDGLLVQPWALTRSAVGFEVSLAATDPLGRGRAKLQTEICPPGAAFSAEGCSEQTSPLWLDVKVSPTITLTVTDLAPSTLYRWRARVLYAPYSVTMAGEPPNPAHGPWRRYLAQSQEADVHTGPLYWIRLPLVRR